MGESKRRRRGFLVAAFVSFGIAVLAFAGVVLSADLTGRLIFGIVWVSVGILWLGSYFGGFFARPGDSSNSDGAP